MSQPVEPGASPPASPSTELPGRPAAVGGPIAWMARNSVAANLLMFVILIGGTLGMSRIKQEVFPNFDLDLIRITVPYPGASPEEVEQGIVLAVEEAVRGVDGVKRVSSGSAEGVGTVAVELLNDADADRSLADVKAAVDRVRSFPEEAEDPVIAVVGSKQRVLSLVVAGNQPLSTLQEIAEQARVGMLQRPNVTQVEVQGLPGLEIAVEISRERLEEFGMTLDEVAGQIRRASLELPGGGIKTPGGELLVRLSDRRKSRQDFEELILRSTRSGATVRLGDIALVTDGYEDIDQANYYNGLPAVRVTAYRVGDESPQQVADSVRAYVQELRRDVPSNITLAIWNDDSEWLRGRIDLLKRNAKLGLFLVLIILALFLNLRLAFWVGLGIPISFMGTFLLMPWFGQTVNMISLFALIIVLGMVVDDAIIVGEAAYAKMLQGKDRLQASIEGAREMAVPVTFAILTTLAAFGPLLLIPGLFGKLFRIIPLMVIGVLVFSLLESFFILPAHLAHIGEEKRWMRPFTAVQERVSAGLDRFIETIYRPVVQKVMSWRYAAVAVALSMLMGGAGIVGSGLVPFSFFPQLEGDIVTAIVKYPYGTNVERTAETGHMIERAAQDTVAKFGGDDILRGMYLQVGQGPSRRGPGPDGGETGSHVVTVEVNLIGSENREFSSEEFKDAWKASVPDLIGTESVIFTANVGPSAGAAVALQLSHRDTAVLEAASREVAQSLAAYSDLTNIENGYASGKRQLDFRLKEEAATALGLSAQAVASQLRAAFYGVEALREQRGRNEVRVMVRLPEEQRRSEYDLESLDIRTSQGGFVPLRHVAEFRRNQAPTSIDREDGRRVVTISGALAPGVRSPTRVLEAVDVDLIPSIKEGYPGLSVGLAGEQREQGEVFASLGPNFLVALFLIFSLLAIPLKSYVQPLVIMSAIPFGFVGAVLGHLVMGYEISFVSVMGIIALAGVVVNDSLVLVETTNRYRREGATAWDAIVRGGMRRLRPILLTSLTTFFGLLPMIFEPSVQARFLIPMAISLGFGVLFATFIILLLVPVFYMVTEDVRVLFGALDERQPGPPQLEA